MELFHQHHHHHHLLLLLLFLFLDHQVLRDPGLYGRRWRGGEGWGRRRRKGRRGGMCLDRGVVVRVERRRWRGWWKGWWWRDEEEGVGDEKERRKKEKKKERRRRRKVSVSCNGHWVFFLSSSLLFSSSFEYLLNQNRKSLRIFLWAH